MREEKDREGNQALGGEWPTKAETRSLFVGERRDKKKSNKK